MSLELNPKIEKWASQKRRETPVHVSRDACNGG